MSDTLVPAAQHLRMSTEHQQYSFDNQSAAIRSNATEHGLEIVESYEDAAKSGLQLKTRTGLQRLLQDVVTHRARFKAILVLDVTRWAVFRILTSPRTTNFSARSRVCRSTIAPKRSPMAARWST